MLHDAPDGMDLDEFDLGGADWSASWQVEAIHDDSLLLNLLAATGQIGKFSTVVPRPLQGAFLPERLSGFCAAG
jgi:hypothetical protein